MLTFTNFHLVPAAVPPPLHHTSPATGMRPPPRFTASVVLGFRGEGIARRCRDSDLEGNFELEDEILEFMRGSEKPEAFPSRRELVEAGRVDLAEAIVTEGGWLSLGWDVGEKERCEDSSDGYETSDLDREEMSGFDFVSYDSASASSSGTSL